MSEPTYPAEFYARLFDVTVRRIQQLHKEGIIPKVARGRYPLIGTIKGYIKYLQERSLGNTAEYTDGDLRTEKLRLTKAQADNMEIKNEMARGQIVPIEIIQVVLSRVSGEAAGELDSIPLNIKRKHPDMGGQVIEDIKRHCVKAQNAISRSGDVLETVLDDYLSDLDAS